MEQQIYSKHFVVKDDGHLYMDGMDLNKIADEYGTPAYVMSDACLRETCRRYVGAMRRNFGSNFKVAYASKALCACFIYKILAEEGMHADVVSGGELYTALKAGFDPKNLHFHGNNKTDGEIDYAAQVGIGSVVIDNYEEIARLEAAAQKYGRTINSMLRIKPGIDAHTHESIMTGQNDSKFGFGIVDGEAMRAAKALSACKHLKFCGIHCHIGSQIFDTEPFAVAADRMMKLMNDMNQAFGIKLTELILGGGFGIKYMPTDKPVDTDVMIDFIGKAVKESAAKYGMEIPEVVIEPGRSTVAPSGCTLYTVGGVKDIKDARCYVSVDGGMPDNPRYALYQAEYDAVVANRANAPKDKVQTIAGKCCESGDLVSKDLTFQTAKPGDRLCVFATGAYNYSMASNYNRIPRAPIVLLKDGKSEIVVKRESYEDLVRNDVL